MTGRHVDLLLAVLWGVSICAVISRPATAAETPVVQAVTANELVGSWRLVRIEFSSAHVAASDPYYGSASTGMLIYDRSGSMSVQIVGQPRPALGVPEMRPQPPAIATRNALQNAAALDTYMAYFGTWKVDGATATVIHQVESSLIPGESGTTYRQSISMEGKYLVMTNRNGSGREQVVRRKIWERSPGSGPVCPGPRTVDPKP